MSSPQLLSLEVKLIMGILFFLLFSKKKTVWKNKLESNLIIIVGTPISYRKIIQSDWVRRALGTKYANSFVYR